MVRGDVQVEDFLQEFGALAPCLGRQGVAHLATEETPEGDCLGRTQLPVTADAHLEVTQEGQREEGQGAGLGSSARVGAAGAVEASEEEASSGCWGGPGGRAPGRIDAHNALDLQVAAHPVAASEDQPAALALRPALVAPLAPHLDLAAQQAGHIRWGCPLSIRAWGVILNQTDCTWCFLSNSVGSFLEVTGLLLFSGFSPVVTYSSEQKTSFI